MSELHTIAEKLWNGEYSTSDPNHHPFAAYALSHEVSRNVVFFKDFVNVTGVKTDQGLVMIDTGSYTPNQHMRCFEGIRKHLTDLLTTAIYTHGHVDHAYGLPPWLEEVRSHKAPWPRIIGHENVAPRMDRYIETDDHTWVYLPDQKVLCTGDLFIWASPNAGNPQKVQRYAIEWARGLRQMATLKPEVLLPGHGVPIYGESRVVSALENTASYLESLYEQTLTLLNQGARIYDIIETVEAPDNLQSLPYLQPIYDEPDFIVRNIVRHLGGWYSGVPSELKPAPRRQLSQTVVDLAGGMAPLLKRVRTLIETDDHDIAAHLIDYAIDAEPDSMEVKALRQEIYNHLASEASSTMSKGIYSAAARESDT